MEKNSGEQRETKQGKYRKERSTSGETKYCGRCLGVEWQWELGSFSRKEAWQVWWPLELSWEGA